jgi:hypothetical protein
VKNELRSLGDRNDADAHINGTSDMTKRSFLAGFTLAAVVTLGSLSSATDHVRSNPSAETFDGVAPASRPLDEAPWRIQRLTRSLDQSRAAAGKNPLLPADVGYYEAELAASRVVQAVATR